MSEEKYKMTEKSTGEEEKSSTKHKVFRWILVAVGVVLAILAFLLFIVVA